MRACSFQHPDAWTARAASRDSVSLTQSPENVRRISPLRSIDQVTGTRG
jgi:hypothetical protein